MPTGVYPRKSLRERFEAKVERIPFLECWVWVGSCNPGGYGQIQIGGGRARTTAPRAAWMLYRGTPIPAGMDLCHTCDNRWCVNPDHLWIGTRKDNLQDMARKGRHFSRTKPDRVARGERHGSRTKPERLVRGEGSASAKLTTADVLAIRAAAASGMPFARIAPRYGVSDVQVANIAHRRQWRHVE